MKRQAFAQHRTLACTMVAMAMLWCLPTSGTAAERQDGKATYEQYCASCHGTAGKGDGPVASGLTTRPPDLTQFAKEAGGHFCTADDPQAGRAVLPQVLTTGTATGTITRANCDNATTIGPFTSHGAPLSCSALGNGSASGGAVAGALPNLNTPTVMDILVTSTQIAQ